VNEAGVTILSDEIDGPVNTYELPAGLSGGLYFLQFSDPMRDELIKLIKR
jgi:hypothetical protein